MNNRFKKTIIFLMAIILVIAPFAVLKIKNVNAESTNATKKITITKKWMHDDTDIRPSNITVHMKAEGSLLLEGSTSAVPNTSPLETKIKSIAGSGTANSENNNVTAIKYATEEQYNQVKSSLTSNNEIQASGAKTYMWFVSSTGTLYMYSEADNIYLNKNSGGIFRKFMSLTDISGLSHLNTSYVQDMNRIFQDTTKVDSFAPISGWDVSKVQNFKFAFGTNDTTNRLYVATSFEPFRTWKITSLIDANQMFKGWGNIDDLEPLKDWDFTTVVDAGQMFNYLGKRTTLKNINVAKKWNVVRVSNFNIMFNNISSGVTKPVFDVRPGYWSGSDYITSVSPLAPITPEAPGTPVLLREYTTTAAGWVKSGNTWTYEFTVDNDNSKYKVWEDEVADYKVIGKGTEANPHEGITTSATIKNIHNKLYITKKWINDKEFARPEHIRVHVKNSSDGSVITSTNTGWTKSGDTWKYTFTIANPDEDSIYEVWEDEIAHYDSNATASNKIAASSMNKAEITNTLHTHDLILNKRVTGNMADIDKSFSYLIKFYDYNNDIVTEDMGFASSSIIKGDSGYTVNLRHNGSITLDSIPEGFTYEITETSEDYEPSYRITKTEGDIPITSGTTQTTGKIELNEDHTVFFTNDKEESILTGIFINNLPFVALLIFGFLGIVILNYYKKQVIEY